MTRLAERYRQAEINSQSRDELNSWERAAREGLTSSERSRATRIDGLDDPTGA
jgi:hypothetical protein